MEDIGQALEESVTALREYLEDEEIDPVVVQNMSDKVKSLQELFIQIQFITEPDDGFDSEFEDELVDDGMELVMACLKKQYWAFKKEQYMWQDFRRKLPSLIYQLS